MAKGSPELYSEQDVLNKVVIPRLVALGYDESKSATNGVVLKYNHPITVQQGREKKTIFADVVVWVHDTPVIVIDAKNPRRYLTDGDREQVVSYARLIEKIAPYSALCNGAWQVFDSVTKQQIKGIPNYRQLVSDLTMRRISPRQRTNLVSQATRTLFAIESARELSRIMRRCHDIIRNLKGYDPTKAFDELSKVLFAKMYEEREIADGRRTENRFTLDSVREMRKQGVEIIQTLWADTIKSDRYREVFSDQDTEQGIDLPPEAIDKIVWILQDKSLGLTDLDVKGVAFEEFLSATYRGGGLGQYFTPREVVSFMVDLAEPAMRDHTIDPSCGSGGFLIRMYDVVSDKIQSADLSTRDRKERLKELANQCLVGIDWEPRAARTCKMNMIIHGDGHAGVYQANALDVEEVEKKVKDRQRFYAEAPSVEEGTFDIVLTNPPFGAVDDVRRILKHYELGKGRSQKREVLLLERCIRMLRPGGRMAVVIPEGILSNKIDARIREYIRNECIIKAVIRLPQDAFRMSEGAACTSILYLLKKDPNDLTLSTQGDIFFARAEHIGISPSGKPINENDLLAIREHYRTFERGAWEGIELAERDDGKIDIVRAEPTGSDTLWLEPTENRTSLLYDRLSYVLRGPKKPGRFSYVYHHPRYYRTMKALEDMPVPVKTLKELCVEKYPLRGKKPREESAEGIPILKVRNITGNGIDWDTEYVPDTPVIRERFAMSFVKKGDILITATGEGTIGRVEPYLYDDEAMVDTHITICRIQDDVNLQYVVEFLRSEHGQIQMLRHISGSTGQTELLVDHLAALRIPMPDPDVQKKAVETMSRAREDGQALLDKAGELQDQGVKVIAEARRQMLALLAESTSNGKRRRGQ
jgi:type I restriction enzyme M protein